MLKGKAKTDYQREYMRNYRLRKQVVRPSELDPVQPKPITPDELVALDRGMAESGSMNRGSFAKYVEIDADGNVVPEFT